MDLTRAALSFASTTLLARISWTGFLIYFSFGVKIDGNQKNLSLRPKTYQSNISGRSNFNKKTHSPWITISSLEWKRKISGELKRDDNKYDRFNIDFIIHNIQFLFFIFALLSLVDFLLCFSDDYPKTWNLRISLVKNVNIFNTSCNMSCQI